MAYFKMMVAREGMAGSSAIRLVAINSAQQVGGG
jgi:hypothetical protein